MAEVTAYADLDCNLRELAPNTNYPGGVAGFEYWGMETKAEEADVCMKIDFSAEVPSDATINVGHLCIYLVHVGNIAPTGLYWRISRCLQAWVYNQATFNIYSTGNNWASPGARGAADYTATDQIVLDAEAPDLDVRTLWEFDATALVVDAQANRSQIFSVVFHGPTTLVSEGDICYYAIDSFVHTDPDYRPYLWIDYTPAGGGVISKISGVEWASVKQVSGVAEASISKASGVQAN